MEYKIKLTGRNYLVPVTEEGNLVLLKDKKGRQLIPVFTDDRQLARLRVPGIRAEVFSYERVKGLIIDDPQQLWGIAVNPFGENIILNQEAIEKIDKATKGMSVRKATHRGTVKLRQPSGLPAGLKDAMEACFDGLEGIRQAWLFLMQGEEETKPHLVMMLDFDGDRKTVFPVVAKAMQPYMKKGESFELMRAEGSLGEYARQKGEAFYCRRPHKAPILN